VNFINRLPNYVTTSSCSGRISCYYSSSTKGIEWKFVKHRTVQLEELNQTLLGLGQDERLLMLKCEPSIIHVLCKDLLAANKLHQLAFSCGYRESGIGIGKKIMVAIRTTAFSLEVPLSLEAKTLVTDEGLKVLVDECNDRLIRNFSRIQRLLDGLKKSESWPMVLPSNPRSNSKISRIISNGNECAQIHGEFASLKEISSLGIQHFAVIKWKKVPLDFFTLSGGRKSLNTPLPCVWSLAMIASTTFTSSSLQYTQVGDIPAPRWGHSLCQFDSRRMLLLGGRNRDSTFQDAYFLEIDEKSSHELITFVWTEIISLPRPAFYHAACYLGETRGVLISGGLSDQHIKHIEQDDGIAVTNLHLMKSQSSLFGENPLTEESEEPTHTLLNRLQWVPVDLPQNGKSRFGHTINSIGAQTLVVLGGSSLDPLFSVSSQTVELWDVLYEQHLNPPSLSVHISPRIFSLSSLEWKLGFGCRSHHCSVSFDDHLYVFGGKLQCEALFGSRTDEPVELRFLSSEPLERPRSVSISFLKPAILIPFHLTKQVKTYFESQKWFDKARRINSPSEEDLFKVLEVKETNNVITSNTRDLSGDGDILANWKAIPVRLEFMSLIEREVTHVSDLKCLLSNSIPLYFLDEQHSRPSKSILVSGHLKAIQYLQQLIPRITQQRLPNNITLQAELEAQLRKDIPTKFEFVGNVIMIPEESLLMADWGGVSNFSEVLQALLDIFNEPSKLKGLGNKYNRIARKAQIDPGPMRESRVRILHSQLTPPSTEEVSLSDSPGWVELVENKILFGFDITKVM
jgi:tRNA(Phe) wybutosine-synthesizing methylase Tyw3